MTSRRSRPTFSWVIVLFFVTVYRESRVGVLVCLGVFWFWCVLCVFAGVFGVCVCVCVWFGLLFIGFGLQLVGFGRGWVMYVCVGPMFTIFQNLNPWKP